MKGYSITVTILLFLLASCQKEKPVVPVVEIPIGTLELQTYFALDVPEPSGLSFGPNGNTLLTVSDHTNQVYELDLQGKIIRTLEYTGKDLEGVTYNQQQNLIAIAEEAEREITLLNYESGIKTDTYKIDIPFGSDNSGLEGISFNTNNKMYYVLNESNPDLMVIWNPTYGIISEIDLNFATDYSGIFVDEAHSLLWIVSDQSKRIYKCDYNAKVLMEFHLPELKFEGIVIKDDLIYLVNDASAELYIYQIKNI